MKIAMLISDDRNEFRRYSDPTPTFHTAIMALLKGMAALPECEIHVVSCTQQPLQSPAMLADNIYYHSLLVPKRGWLRGAYVGCVRAIRRKLREIKPDLVHGHGTERYCALAAVYSGFPNVVTIHGNMREIARVNAARPFSFHWLTAKLERWTLPRTYGVFCNSRYTHQQVAPLARATWMMPNPVREAFFAPPTGSADKPAILLNIGDVTLRKSQHELLRVAARLHQRGAKFQLSFIGRAYDDPYGIRFLTSAKEAEQKGYASYIGVKSELELVELMDRASALIHFPKEEAFGLVVPEALARNMKLFASKVGGIVDIVSGVEGVDLVDPTDLRALEEAIFNWIAGGNPKIKHGAELMRERYHPLVIARRHVKIFHEVISV